MFARGVCQSEPKARSVIYLFMCSGVSQIDTFDPKDRRFEGKLIDATGFGDRVGTGLEPAPPTPPAIRNRSTAVPRCYIIR